MLARLYEFRIWPAGTAQCATQRIGGAPLLAKVAGNGVARREWFVSSKWLLLAARLMARRRRVRPRTCSTAEQARQGEETRGQP